MSVLDAAGPQVEVKRIWKRFATGRQGMLAGRHGATTVTAVADVSLTIGRAETVGLIGESGSGKTTVGRCIALLERPDAGEISAFGERYLELDKGGVRRLRRQVQIVFQDSRASLDPRWTVRKTLREPLQYLTRLDKGEWEPLCRAAMADVGLGPEMLDRYRHQLSGGQAQRVNIARALVAEPKLVILDEPVASVDAALRRQLTSLLRRLQDQRGLSYLLISHDIRHVLQICDRVAVMHKGELVELNGAQSLVAEPQHPYTRWFLRASRGETADEALADARSVNP